MLTEFFSFPKPDSNFSLFYLEYGEFLISSVRCSLKSSDFDFSEGKLHLCTRSLIFQPQFPKAPLIKIKLSNADLTYTYKFPSVSVAQSPNAKPRMSLGDRSPSPLFKSSPSVLILSVQRCQLINRHPPTPGLSHKLEENLEFRMSQNDLLKLSTELDMVGRSGEEKHMAQIIFSIRYKELLSMLNNTDDYNPDEVLLNHKCKRIVPEGEQWGAFILTQISLHFYALMNSKPKDPLHVSFQDMKVCSRYKYQGKSTGLRIDLYSSPWPLLYIFETEEQREGIYRFIQNKTKFKNPLESLSEFTERWVYGRLNNFEYLMTLNNLANRCTADFSQYPVFPWVLSRYQSSINLDDPNCYRDLGKHIGELESSRHERLKILQQDRGESLYSSFYSNPSIINYYLLRAIPELLVRNQNQVFFNAERLFTSIEKSWSSCVKQTGDYRELCPEFYSNSAFLVNLKDMQAVGNEALNDVELPQWAENAEHFVETMRNALESDYVSQNLHKWIDLIFGCKQREDEQGRELFPETCYGVNWSAFKVNLEKEAYDVICREFGQCPEQLFYVPHPPRVFRKNSELFPVPFVPEQVPLLELYLNNLQETHQQQINNMLDNYYKSKKRLEIAHNAELDELNLKINGLKQFIRKGSEDNSVDSKGKESDDKDLNSLHSREVIKSKSPNLIPKHHDFRVNPEQEFSKTKIEATKKTRKIQSKTPTKPF